MYHSTSLYHIISQGMFGECHLLQALWPGWNYTFDVTLRNPSQAHVVGERGALMRNADPNQASEEMGTQMIIYPSSTLTKIFVGSILLDKHFCWWFSQAFDDGIPSLVGSTIFLVYHHLGTESMNILAE